MTKKKQPLLKVIEHNWGLIGPGDWRTVTWLVYHDGSYEVVSSFNPIINDSEELMGMINRRERPKLVKKQSTGIMEEDAINDEFCAVYECRNSDVLKVLGLKKRRPLDTIVQKMQRERFCTLPEAPVRLHGRITVSKAAFGI